MFPSASVATWSQAPRMLRFEARPPLNTHMPARLMRNPPAAMAMTMRPATSGGSCSRRYASMHTQTEFGAVSCAESLVERALVVGEEGTGPLVRGAASRGDGRADGAAVFRIGDASDEPVSLEAIDQLRHVGLAATVSFSQLGECERL